MHLPKQNHGSAANAAVVTNNLRDKFNSILAKRETEFSNCGNFAGSKNPRQVRALSALLRGPCSRAELARMAGCANAPDLIMQLRRRGLGDDLQCKFVKAIDRDNKPVEYGVYSLTERGRAAVLQWATAAKVEILRGAA